MTRLLPLFVFDVCSLIVVYPKNYFVCAIAVALTVVSAFLRAERQSDGGRTFKLIEGEPLQTSYGEDLYNKIFGIDN